MLAASDLVVAVTYRPSGRLVGFARVMTDEVYPAVVLDVIVAPDVRGSGLGETLLDAIVGHPRLASIGSIELVCQPDLMPFNRRWGFTDQVGESRLMRRTIDAEPAVFISQVLARKRTAVAVEANPRAISQMPNVSSNNPPGMAPTSPAPATPNSSSSEAPAKHA
jgi:GNAT superfamily N-acetyltransferase